MCQRLNQMKNPLNVLPEINFPLFLAPMVGLTHLALRRTVRRYLPENAQTLFPTEMLSTRRLPAQAVGRTPETFRDHEELDLNVQILGNEEKYVVPSLKKLEIYGARAVDLNMGCPVKRALRHNYGVSLMGDPNYAKEIVAMAVANTKLPISVKIRAGLTKDEDALLRFVEGLKEAGASWVCLHPRLAEQKRRGNADWSQIKNLKQNFSLPLIGNGDVQIVDDIHGMFDQTGCDGVMIGRALTARPWLLWQYGEDKGLPAPVAFKGQKAPRTGEEEAYAYGEMLIHFMKDCQEIFEAKDAFKRVLFFVNVSHSWLNFGHPMMLQIKKQKSVAEMIPVVEQFFSKSGLSMTKTTDLRY